ncbi:MAG TPA: chemotaxis protein CheW [Sphingomonas sp.]|jgi:purine-binding chemotaxis protein CheW|uniref:chemotaxis protein CheW n=1 Tax=Sphingomonas sp. TaxID=28214 RepID=UPI002EDA893B
MTQKLITCQIGEQFLGIDIMAIREIRVWQPATPLPGTPAHILGVVNLRGTAVPVLDLRQRLGWGVTNPNERNVIIVVQVEDQLQGLIVDAVDDVASFETTDMQPVPDTGISHTGALLAGLVNAGERMILLLQLDHIVERVPQQVALAA